MVRTVISYGKQSIDNDDIEAVVEVLKSDYLTQGPSSRLFEEALFDYCGSRYACVLNSGTSALYTAYKSLGLKHGKVLWTTPISFVATSNAALSCGANVDFVDISPDNGNMDMNALQLKLSESTEPPDFVVPVHFAGVPCDMITLNGLAKQYDFMIIEDASHALGAEYAGQKIGDCSYSDACVFSFHPIKSIACGEGGAVLTNDSETDARVRSIANNGIRKLEDESSPWRYEQIMLGHNFRMSDIHAALGISQMRKLDEFIRKRREISLKYLDLLDGLPISMPTGDEIMKSACHLFVIRLDDSLLSYRSDLYRLLHQRGVGVQVHYIPIHTQPYYQELGFRIGSFPEAEKFYSSVLSLPVFPDLTDEQQNYIVASFREAIERYQSL